MWRPLASGPWKGRDETMRGLLGAECRNSLPSLSLGSTRSNCHLVGASAEGDESPSSSCRDAQARWQWNGGWRTGNGHRLPQRLTFLAKLPSHQAVHEIRGIGSASRANELDGPARHGRRDLKLVLCPAGTLHLHRSAAFITQGFSSTSPGFRSRVIAVLAELSSTCPSEKRKLPPNCRWLLPGGLPSAEKTGCPAPFG